MFGFACLHGGDGGAGLGPRGALSTPSTARVLQILALALASGIQEAWAVCPYQHRFLPKARACGQRLGQHPHCPTAPQGT